MIPPSEGKPENLSTASRASLAPKPIAQCLESASEEALVELGYVGLAQTSDRMASNSGRLGEQCTRIASGLSQPK